MSKEKNIEKKASKVPENETPNERFLRVANPRIKIAIKRIRLITNMIKSPAYEVTAENQDKIVTAFEKEVIALSNAFKTPSKEIEDVL